VNVLVIPEDFRKDQYMLKPIIEAMLKKIGKGTAIVRVCQNPNLGGIGQALKWEKIQEIIERYPMVDLFLLCVDRDGYPGRRKSLDNIEVAAGNILTNNKLFLAENAWQEIEVWVLAGHKLPKTWTWKKIRADINPKENFYLPYAKQLGVVNLPSEGRKELAEAAARQYPRILQLCPEDIQALHTRLDNWLNKTP